MKSMIITACVLVLAMAPFQTSAQRRTSNVLPTSDSSITIHYKGNTYTLAGPTTELSRLDGFQTFLDTYTGNPAFLSIQLVDITGDGRLDSCVSRTYASGQKVKLARSIYSSGEQIWFDTLTVDQGYYAFPELRLGDSSYFALTPFSSVFTVNWIFSQLFVHPLFDLASIEGGNMDPNALTEWDGTKRTLPECWKPTWLISRDASSIDCPLKIPTPISGMSELENLFCIILHRIQQSAQMNGAAANKRQTGARTLERQG